MKSIKDILTTMSESALRPADSINVGQLEPVTLSPADFQATPPAVVEPFLANVTGAVTDTNGLDEKEFINDPALSAVEGNNITSVDDITARINGVVSEDVSSILDKVMGQLIVESIYEVKLKDQLGGMFESQGLNEDFTEKATDIFEAAVTCAGKKHLNAISEAANKYIAEQLEVYHQATQGQINSYLTTVVNEWAEDNKLAIEMGARTKIAESFMDGLKGLLESHYVDLPKDRVDLYEAACATGDKVLKELEEAKVENSSLAEEIKTLKRSAILESALAGTTAVNAEKIRSLAESIAYTDDKSYKSRLTVVVESLNSKSTAAKPLTEEFNTPVVAAKPVAQATDEVSQYVAALDRLGGRRG